MRIRVRGRSKYFEEDEDLRAERERERESGIWGWWGKRMEGFRAVLAWRNV